MKFACPDCDQHLTAGPDLAGKIVKCPACGSRVQIPDVFGPEFGTEEEEEEGGEPSAPRILFSGHTWSDQCNIPFWQSAIFATLFFGVFYGLLLPFKASFFGQMFLKRGFVPFVLIWMLGACFGILFFKWLRLRRQRQALLLDVLPTDIAEEISEDTLPQFIDHLNHLPEKMNDSFMVNRIRRGLEHFHNRKSQPEVATMMQSQSDIDATNIHSSFTMLRVFIWAIPILGFIGTVLGISQSVSEFSGDMGATTAEMAAKIGLITGGLGLAFDTTLIALVISIIVSFPTNAQQKNEGDLLNRIDEYCNENLLKRLDDKGGISEVVVNTEAIARDLTKNMAGDQVQILSSLHALQSDLSTSQTDHLRLFAEASKSLGTRLQQAHAGVENHQKQVGELLGSLAATIEQQGQEAIRQNAASTEHHQARIADMLQGVVKSVEDEGREAMQKAAASLEGQLQGLDQTLSSLSEVLGRLGEQQVVIQQVEAPRKRGWFGRG